MNKKIFFSILILLTFGCESLKEGLGLKKNKPDEFLIKKLDPIEKPPDFELLLPDSKAKQLNKNKSSNLKSLIDKNVSQDSTVVSQDNIQNSSNVEEQIIQEIKK